MGLFQKARDMYRMQKQAKGIKKDLKNIHIEAEHEGIAIVINAEMELISVSISDEAMQQATNNKKTLEEKIMKAFTKGMKKAQQIAAEKMRGVMGDFGMGQ